MKLSSIREKAGSPGWLVTITRLALILTAIFLSIPATAATTKQKTFASPEKAVQAFLDSLKKNDKTALTALFGPDSAKLLSSGDPVNDEYRKERFVAKFEEAHRLEREGKNKAAQRFEIDSDPDNNHQKP